MTANQAPHPLPPTEGVIGIIAGQGQFPALTADAARKQGLPVIICGFHGHTDPEIARHGDVFAMYHLGQFGHVIKFFRKHKVSHVCFAGAISKPKALSIRPDLTAVKIILSLRGLGDDALLRAIAAELENNGMQVIQAASLVPGLPGPLGPVTGRTPTQREWEDILFGWPKAQEIGRLDIGQCIAVRKKMILAVECLEGTDATLRRGGELGGKGAVAIKIVKPGQDERVDLPAIGLNTISTLIEGGYACLAYHAGKTLFFDREESVRLAEQHQLTVIGLPGGLDPEDPFHAWWESESPATMESFLARLRTAALPPAS